jgi:hypothetical protein
MILKQAKKIYQNNPTKALLIGAGAVIVTPILLPLLKPVAKSAIKTGLVLYEKTKGAIAEAGEVLGDIVAEAKAEIATEQAQQNALQEEITPEQEG